MMDLKTIQADFTLTEDSQNSKYSQKIQIFGLCEPKNNGANQMIFSFPMFVLLALFFVLN
jgi:hypothetical protein